MEKLNLLILALFLTFLAACSDNDSLPPAPELPPSFELLIEVDDPNIHIGNTTYLKAYRRNQQSGETSDITHLVSFRSNAPDIAALENNGPKVIAVSEGKANFSFDYHGQSTDTVIHVKGGYITHISINSPDNHLHVGSTSQMTAIATYDDDSTDNITDTAEWISVDDFVAYFRIQGSLLYTNSSGISDIYATRDGLNSAVEQVTVHRGTMVDFTINSSVCCTINKGRTIDFYALSYWEDGNKDNVSGSTTWSTDDSAVLKQLDKKYKFLAEEIGNANISGNYNGFSATQNIIVERALVSNLRVTMDAVVLETDRVGTNYWIERGSSTQLTAWGDLSDGTKDADVSHLVEWRWGKEGTEAQIEIDESYIAHGIESGFVIIYVVLDNTSSEYRGVTLWINDKPSDSP